MAGLSHARVATGGSFAQHDRRIEVAMPWADIAAAVSPSRQPGGDIVTAVKAGFTFGSEPLLVNNDYNGQAFLGPDQWNPPSGVDVFSRDIRLMEAALPGEAPAINIRAAGDLVELLWPASAVGFALETSPQPGAGAVWSRFDGSVSVENGMNKATIAPSAAAAFYRLHK